MAGISPLLSMDNLIVFGIDPREFEELLFLFFFGFFSFSSFFRGVDLDRCLVLDVSEEDFDLDSVLVDILTVTALSI